MSHADNLRSNWQNAKARLQKIGTPEPHLKSVGRLSTLSVRTDVCHQAAPSETNYWKDEPFDLALSMVVERRFAELSAEALALMEKEANDALVSEEEMLRERLARIEQIKSAA